MRQPTPPESLKPLADYTELERQEVKKRYLAASGTCPFCGSEDIEGVGREETEAGFHSNLIRCPDCERRWWDVYMLTDIDVEGWETPQRS